MRSLGSVLVGLPSGVSWMVGILVLFEEGVVPIEVDFDDAPVALDLNVGLITDVDLEGVAMAVDLEGVMMAVDLEGVTEAAIDLDSEMEALDLTTLILVAGGTGEGDSLLPVEEEVR